ncbi:membrane protein with putative acyltransferase activity [Planktothrix serta PCC 8927]|uniref:Membrane protein with putative acyltransferase activity n=1 Tax=Planktothrix serta PCC 8927 TaxID=671068 RepID=A0A1J1JNN6_9CYAN|nr:acyltransferase [Planktothrix serta]CZT62782.1 membrane protein with putative acyltransferase activity [Planktothrix serta PCC 8927]VXD10544.1 membrane protein with putative acyltransferase activity [Planktothrix serta PCC 8927]
MAILQGKYWLGGDVIRVLAIWGVMFIHVVQVGLYNPTEIGWSWWSINVTQSLFIWAVPAFFIISGMLLMGFQNNQETWSDFYRKRLPKVGIPLIVWGSIYMPLEFRWNLSKTPTEIWHDFWIGQISWHLYFLLAIIGLYLLTPWLRLWLAKLSQTQQAFAIAGIFTLMAILEIFQVMNGIFLWNIATQWIPDLGYYLFGYYFIRYQSERIPIIQYLCLFFIGLLGNVSGKYVECITTTHSNGYFYSTNYNSVSTIPLAIGCFGILVYITESVSEQNLVVKWCKFLTPSVFGIYLIHVLILRELHYSLAIPFSTNALTGLIETALLFPLCLFCVYLLGLIPFGDSIVGFNTLSFLRHGGNRMKSPPYFTNT